jgi:hypothetical protein
MGAVLAPPKAQPPRTTALGVDTEARRTLASRWGPLSLRGTSHVVVWSLVLVPTVIQMARGWRAVRDDAMISIGSYRVFSSHSPLVGAWSQASQGMRHPFFDLGPLLFWLLAVPVRLDPHQGALWGAALVCGGALSLAVEAAWSVKRWPACVAVALVAANVGWQTQFFDDLVWNPHFGLVFMMAAGATAWTVASGKFGWWPVEVFLASVAAQCHLLYAISSVTLVVVAPLVALACGRRPPRRRWIVTGVAVGAVCWVPPLVQQVFGHPGNMTLILESGSARARIGLGFGLHSLATAVAPRPIWLSAYPFLSVPHFLDTHGRAGAVVALLLLSAVAVAARLTKRGELCALAVIGLVLALGTVASFATLPKDDIIVVSYLSIDLWVVGALVWIVMLWAVGDIVTAAIRRDPRHRRGVGGRILLVHALEVAGLALLVIGGVEGVRTLVPAAHARMSEVQQDRPLDSSIARSVERSVAAGPVVVDVQPPVFDSKHGFYGIDYWGTAFALLAKGWQPELPYGFYGAATHLSVPPGTHAPKVTVTVDPADKAVVGVLRREPDRA